MSKTKAKAKEPAAMLYRSCDIPSEAMAPDSSEVALSFSSESPVLRYDYTRDVSYLEVLDHSDGSADFSRLNNGGAFLVNHNTDDMAGAIKRGSAKVENRRGVCSVILSRSERGREILADMMDGIRTLVSFGYQTTRLLKTEVKGGMETRYFAFKALEVSTVPIPADDTVGVSRAEENQSTENNTENLELERNKTMTTTETVPAPAAPTPTVTVQRDLAKEQKEMYAIAKRTGKMDAYEKAIERGETLDGFRAEICNSFTMQPVNDQSIGLSKKEARAFSFAKVALALANPSDRAAQENAKFELEVSAAAADKRGGNARGIVVPSDVLTRDQTVGTNGDGGYLVATNLLAGSFIDVLRKRLVVAQAGAQTLGGLIGNVAIPRQTAGVTTYWVAESGSPTEGSATFDQVTMSPKTVGAFVDLSRRTLLQTTPGIEMLIRNSLIKDIATEIDRAALHGSGSSNQPTGVAAQSGIGSVAGGTNGLAPTWANIVALESAIANSNADGSTCAYITNSRARGKLKTVLKNASGTDASFIWQDGGFMDGVPTGIVNGYKALVSNQVSNTLTKGTASGVCSAVFFADWSNLIIGNWGSLNLDVDRATLSSQGAIRLVALQDVDVAVKQPTAFAACLDVLTT